MSTRPLRDGEQPQDMLREGYNRAAPKYHAFTTRIKSPRLAWLDKLYAGLGNAVQTARALELGCGTGDPCTVHLAQHVGTLVATDLSSGQLEFARRALERDGCVVEGAGNTTQESITSTSTPSSATQQDSAPNPSTQPDHRAKVQLVEADMLGLDFADAEFDATCAFYSLHHLRIAEQREMLARCARWLRPGGFLLFNCAGEPDEGVVMENWLGMDAYSAGLGEERAVQALRDVGLDIVEVETAKMEVDVPFTWILAQKHTTK